MLDIIFEDVQQEYKRPAGPFTDVPEFNDYFMNIGWTKTEPPKPCTHFMRPTIPDDQPIFFTHADLTPPNIIISTSFFRPPTVVGIIDFHQSGWYPAYWEACKATWVAGDDSEWGKLLPDVFAPHGEYLKIFPWMTSAGWAL